MIKFTVAAIAGAALCGAGITGPASAMPMSNLAATPGDLSPSLQNVAYECWPYQCWSQYPSYYDTPDYLRPRVFYGYEPHQRFYKPSKKRIIKSER